jgi:hypothetical protein
MDEFKGAFKRLRRKVRASGAEGEWTQIKIGHQFHTNDGALLNWNRKTGVIHYQGNLEAANKLRSALAKTDVRESLGAKVRRILTNANWAGAGVFISILALLTSVYSSYETRKQARLAVQPHILLHFSANDKGAGWLRTISGAGPAIINAFEVTVDGKPVQTWDDVMVASGIDINAPITGRLAIPTPGTYLLPGIDTTRPLLWVETPGAMAALVKNSHRVAMTLVYCSLYDECWERSLSELEPVRVPKRKLETKFGMSQRWREGFSKSPD